ncbi:MAG TPA: hypothetical protein VJS39_14065, partial [Gemmatimonadaceae bacterium]|nr:hypothetical protein [Gemmatimonadaceae bacterium]
GATKHTFYGFVVTAFGIPLLIAIWWLVQFNMRTTKAAFATSASVPGSGKPVPVIALGWLSILGAAACAISVLTGAPAFLLGGTFTGSSAAIIYILFAAICIYIGKGLLDLDERTRVVAIWWYAFSFLQILLVAFVPSIRDRVFDFQTQIASNQSNPGPFDTDLALNVLLSVTSVFTAVILWILVQYRDAFTATQSA